MPKATGFLDGERGGAAAGAAAESMWRQVYGWLDRRIAEALRRAGIVGDRVDAAHLVNSLYLKGGPVCCIGGSLATTSGGSASPIAPVYFGGEIEEVVAYLTTPGTGGSTVVVVLVNGTAILTFAMDIGQYSLRFPASMLTLSRLNEGDQMQLDVTKVGMGAANLTVGIKTRLDVALGQATG